MTAHARLCPFTSLTRAFAAGLTCTLCLCFASGQDASREAIKAPAPVFWRPYLAPNVPPARLNNSQRMKDLIRAGNLYLTVQDAIALVLENNIDIEVARYDPMIAAWQLQRSEAGGALPPPLNAASLVGSVAPGQGVNGSEMAADVTSAQRSGNTVVRSTNTTISPLGPVTDSFDPVFQESSIFSHSSQPQTNTLLTLTPVLVSSMHASTAVLQEGFISGGSASLTYTDHYLSENAFTDLINPSVAPNLSLTFVHNLLRGFGVAVNSRNIVVSKINLHISDLTFDLQLISAVSQTLNSYYELVADYQDTKAKQTAVAMAQALYDNNKRQAEVGALTRLDVTSAESQLAAAERDLLISQTSLDQHEMQLKSLLSRTGPASTPSYAIQNDPLLKYVRILPIDQIDIPTSDDLPSYDIMLRQALAHRADLAIEKAAIEAAEASALGDKNGLLPALLVSGGETDAGLAGRPRTIRTGKSIQTANPLFVGGTGAALAQVFRRDNPTDRVGISFEAPIHNRLAQADYGFDQISLRQIELANQKEINQVQVDLMTSIAKLQQVRAQYEAAVRNRILAKELLDSERERYSAGASTLYNITQQQRSLTVAQSAEIVAMVNWSTARIALDQVLGTTLEANHISIAEGKLGKVARPGTRIQ